MTEDYLKILIADDDSFVRDMLCAILESAGYDVDTAENGAEALKIFFSDSSYDLIISDMNMPEKSGLDIIKEVRGNEFKVPIIILTGNNEISIAIDALKSGANDYILKDENIQDVILISIGKVIENYRLKRQNIALLEDLERKNKELNKMAFVDGLTGISNRRYFEDSLNTEWETAVKESIPLSVILIDIDFFKLYNDTYGHQQGDICLKQVAQTLNESAGISKNIVARYGGEEFVAVLPGQDEKGAGLVANKMISGIALLQIPHESSTVSDIVTVSLGVGCGMPNESMTPADLLKIADRELYKAKKNGRNQVQISNDAELIY